jgi:uncharacterized protein DUF4873
MRIPGRRRGRRSRPIPWVPEHDDEDGYRGPAHLHVGDRTIDVEVVLGGHLEPLDGKYHWYGRVVQADAVDAAKRGGATDVALTIGEGTRAPARLAEHDAWGNMRITGLGAPPFELEPVEVTHPASVRS